ncbi:hypothetical protein BDZ89DRAFT_1161232 [Hymenopellis radicata]|nr:hypothetical protein BDZ89DRAFT_1161232 [Hymenopellis radicata]
MTHTEDILQFNSADADAVLVSCDGARFAVHKCILSLASPFFKDMFSLPQPSSSSESSIQRNLDIECTETKDVLFALLQFIYPVPNPNVASLDELVPLLEAARKFQLDYLVDELGTTLTDERLGFVKEAPLRVYAIATRFGFEEEMRVAAKGTLRYNVLACPLNEDLKNINAYDYHRLLDLHRRHAKATQEALRNYSKQITRCRDCGSVPKWWTQFLELADLELSERPSVDVICTHEFIASAVTAARCTDCATSAFHFYSKMESMKKSIDGISFDV